MVGDTIREGNQWSDSNQWSVGAIRSLIRFTATSRQHVNVFLPPDTMWMYFFLQTPCLHLEISFSLLRIRIWKPALKINIKSKCGNILSVYSEIKIILIWFGFCQKIISRVSEWFLLLVTGVGQKSKDSFDAGYKRPISQCWHKKTRSSYLHKWSYDAWIFHCNHHRVLLGEAGMGKSGWQDPGRGCHSCWMAGESSLVTIVGKGDFASGNWIFDYWKNFPNYFPNFLPKLGEGLFFRRHLSLS